jgi:transcriptional regulator with XRE-family HTH domain
MDIDREIADRLNFACDKLGIQGHGEGRQRSLAEAVGCTQEAARKWLRGYTKPSSKFMLKLAEFLQVDVAWLQFGSEPAAVKKKEKTTVDERVSGSVYYVFGCFKMLDIPVVMANPDAEEDLVLFNKGKQHLVAISPAEVRDEELIADVSAKLSEGTKTIVVIQTAEFGRVDQIVLEYEQLQVLGKNLGGYIRLNLTKSHNRQYLVGDQHFSSKIVVNKAFG